MEAIHIVFRVHAIQRMFQRGITPNDVRQALATSEVIESYPDDTPYPSRLLLGWCGTRPLHVVIADNKEKQETIVVTIYEPELNQWEADFRKRRKV